MLLDVATGENMQRMCLEEQLLQQCGKERIQGFVLSKVLYREKPYQRKCVKVERIRQRLSIVLLEEHSRER